MTKAFVKFIPAHIQGNYFDLYNVMKKLESSTYEPAILLKSFYGKKDSEKYRDMVNGKIEKDVNWMHS